MLILNFDSHTILATNTPELHQKRAEATKISEMQQSGRAQEPQRVGKMNDANNWQSSRSRVATRSMSEGSIVQNPCSTKWYADNIITAIQPQSSLDTGSFLRLQNYVDAADQHAELAIALATAKSFTNQHCKPVRAIIQYLCRHAHVLRRLQTEYHGEFECQRSMSGRDTMVKSSAKTKFPRSELGTKASLRAGIHETLAKLFKAATQLYHLSSAGMPRPLQRLRGWYSLNEHALSMGISGHSVFELVVECLIRDLPPSWEPIQIKKKICEVFGPVIKGKACIGMPRVIFIAQTKPPTSTSTKWLVGATKPDYTQKTPTLKGNGGSGKQWVPRVVMDAIIAERTRSLIKGNNSLRAMMRMKRWELDVVHESPLPSMPVLPASYYPDHPGQAYLVNCTNTLQTKDPCTTCRQLHMFSQGGSFPSGQKKFPVPACAEAAWVAKAARFS